MLDVFKSSLFNTTTLTAAVNKMPFVPGRLGQMGIFEEVGVATTGVVIEEREGTLSLIPTTPRGAPNTQNKKDLRTGRTLTVPRLSLEDRINADAVQNVRMFGTNDQAMGVQMEVQQRQASMVLKMDATLEHLRIGAIKGIIYDSDGTTVLYNLFTEFGVTQAVEIDFDLDNATPAKGAVRKKCSQVIRAIEDVLGATPYSGIVAECSSQFMDDLTSHSECLAAYDRWNDGQWLREQTARRTFFYAGILFEEYRGAVGNVKFIADDKAHFFPIGVPGLFKTAFAPGDFVEAVNTIGLPRYSKIAPDQKYNQYVDLLVQSNPLPFCTRPAVLIKARRT